MIRSVPALLLLTACGLELETYHDSGIGPWGGLSFRLPLSEPWRFPSITGFDHDPVDETNAAACRDYAGRSWPWCYDQHTGSDFSLQGGLAAMDDGSSPVVAAADGVVVDVVDGNYDRCLQDGEFGVVDCDGYPMVSNTVVVEHEGGIRTKYSHLKKFSITVSVGDEVGCGDPLGLVGSSGFSMGPHLHFGVYPSPDEPAVDAYSADGDGWWVDQGTVDGLPGTDCAL